MHAIDRLSRALHRHLVAILTLTYLVAFLLPKWGQILRWHHLGTLQLGEIDLPIPVPTVLLSVLLCSASISIDPRQIRQLGRRPALLLSGLAVNLALPMLFLGLISTVLARWPDDAELKSVLLGLAILGATPIAGSSTAWAQQAHGNLALSLGLVLVSTVLSPIITPVCFSAMAVVTSHRYDAELLLLGGVQTRFFLIFAVFLPSLVGLMLHGVLGARRVAKISPVLRLSSMVALISLNYINAAAALPHLARGTDWTFVGLVGGLAATLCALRYTGGYLVGRAMSANRADTTSMVYGLGMNNNGTGLVLASQQLPDDTNLMVMMVVYTLLQQFGAGVAQAFLRRAKRLARPA